MDRKSLLPQLSEAPPEKKPKICFYLEDNTPIRTIEVSNVAIDSNENCSEEFIRDYFERIGPVERVIGKVTINGWLAYVTFAQPEHVAALIHNKDVTGSRCLKFAIKIADDAHQIDPNVLSLERVNDDCLLYIMSYLSLFDAINLCKTSKRMESIGKIYFKKCTKFTYGTAQQDSSINEANLPVVLEVIGDHISSIHWQYITAAQLDLLAKHCPNVTELKLTSPEIGVNKAINEIRAFFGNLKKVYIDYNHFDGPIRNNVRQNMISGNKLTFTKTNHDQLKNVKIIDSQNIQKEIFNLHERKDGTFVSDTCCNYLLLPVLPTEKLERIEELHLDISSFNGDTAGLNFSGLKKLKKLTLTRRSMYNVIDANSMIDKLSQIDSLESLSIYRITIDTNTIQRLRSLKNLKYLKMNGIDNNIGKKLYEQIREYLSTLRELTIYEQVDIFEGKPILDMIAGMPFLNYFSHSSITWEWLDGIRQYKSITVLDEKKPTLRIGVEESVFNNPKKEEFEAIHNGAITLCIQQ